MTQMVTALSSCQNGLPQESSFGIEPHRGKLQPEALQFLSVIYLNCESQCATVNILDGDMHGVDFSVIVCWYMSVQLVYPSSIHSSIHPSMHTHAHIQHHI